MRPKHILLVEMNEDGTVGGSHQALFDLVRLMDRTRFRPAVLLYQPNPFEARLRELDVDVHSYEVVRQRERELRRMGNPVRKKLDIVAAIYRRWSFLRRHSIDLVHLNNYPWLGGDDWLPAARLLGIPCITWAMGDAFGPVDAVRAFLAKRFDRVVAISQYMAGVMRRHGVPEGRLETINLGVDPERLRSLARRPTPEVRRELGVAPGQLLAVMVGNIRPWKGQAVVLRALHLLDPSARSQLRVAFAGAVGAGDEGYAGALRESVREWGLDACVSFLGRRADVPDLLNAADLAIHASLIPEPAGLVVLEAMALGAPVIAANRGGPQEYLSDGAGCTFDSEKPAELAAFLSELLRSDERRHELARKARVRVEQYTVAQNVRGVQALYDRLLGTS